MTSAVVLTLGIAEATDSPGAPGQPGGLTLGQTIQLLSQADLDAHTALTNPHNTSYDNLVAPSTPIRLPVFTTATRPAAGTFTGGLIFVSDASANEKVQVSDGTNWLPVGG